ncbi:MAG: hypothetical protein ACKPKO_12560, partial [Candidatus Fonsibacter sp.]
YDNEVGLFTSTFKVTKTGNGYINGNLDCGGLLTAPNIYKKTQVDNLVSGKQNTITSSTDLTINKLTCNNFEPTTVNNDMIIKSQYGITWRYYSTYITIRCRLLFLLGC